MASNLQHDIELPLTNLTDLRKTIKQTGEQIQPPASLTAGGLPLERNLFSEQLFDQVNISTTRRLLFQLPLTPTTVGSILQFDITPQWVLNNINRFEVTATHHYYWNFIIHIDIEMIGSPITFGSIVSRYVPDGFPVNFFSITTVPFEQLLSATRFAIQPTHTNSVRSWNIDPELPMRCFTLTQGLPSPGLFNQEYKLGSFDISVLNTISSNSTVASTPDLRVYTWAELSYGGSLYTGSQLIT